MSFILFEELNSVTTAVCAVLDDYVNTCAKLRDHYFQERAVDKLDELLDRVANEIQLVASYGVKLKRAEASMKVVRNSSPSVVPISSLPPEILNHIFHIVLNNQPDPVDAMRAPFDVSISFPKHPETLSHVCFGWRQIALAAHDLWTRIDLVLHHPLGPRFLARAQAHVDRAGELPLEVYMVGSPQGRRHFLHSKPDEFEDFDFLAFGNTPMRAINVVSYRGLHDAHYSFIYYCIANCAQQTLKQLTIRDASPSGGSRRFIESTDNQHDSKSVEIDLPENVLEGVWNSTSVLRLVGLYPYWTSQAYHQLVDLRLGSENSPFPSISEAQVLEMLKASPRLRIFHILLDVTDPLPDTTLTVQLHELESVKMNSVAVGGYETEILRFIIPSQKALQFSIIGQPTPAVEQFLRRSNVTQLRMVGWETYPPSNALRLCPNLQALVLDVWGNKEQVNFQTTPEHEDGAMTTPMRLQSLYILRCEGLSLTDLQQIVEKHSVHELTLWMTYPMVGRGDSGSRPAYDYEVSSICPVVNYLKGRGRDRNPMDDWDRSD
ncbi:hypothetical protein B0J17DRAFT_641053 [Rhizoctonia solani]|nr:hypothetical protein B0J17DRAFT_641053 [Rhizoctonia solani]